jgi:hypothetical protein
VDRDGHKVINDLDGLACVWERSYTWCGMGWVVMVLVKVTVYLPTERYVLHGLGALCE